MSTQFLIKQPDNDFVTKYAAIGDIDKVKELVEQRLVNINYQDLHKDTALLIASCNNHVDVLKYLLEHGADPNLKNNDGETALSLSVANGYTEIVKLLLSHNADPNSRNYEGRTPFLWSVINNKVDITQILFDNNADHRVKDANNMNALQWAKKLGHHRALFYLRLL